MRVTIEIETDPDGRVEGSVAWDGSGMPLAFSGWLDLLRLLEELAAPHDDLRARSDD